MTDKLKIAELTSGEAREHINKDTVILLPMGSLEDQGTHAPMGDYMAADCVALDIARAARAEGGHGGLDDGSGEGEGGHGAVCVRE